MTRLRLARRVAMAIAVLASVACAPRLVPLTGRSVPARLPQSALPRGHRHIVFKWTLDDRDFSSRGEGAARMAYPDSVRVDFFLGGGMGSGMALLIRDSLQIPESAGRLARRIVPSAPLLWAAFGRARVRPARDTAVRVDGDTLRADIGNPVAWRLIFARDSLRRVERVAGGRIVEWVVRFADGRIRYRDEASRRQLDLTVTRSVNVAPFDAAIWALP